MSQNDEPNPRTRVLWADDDALDDLQPIGTLLESRGLAVTVATNYHEALRRLKERQDHPPSDRFKTLLVDTMLPPDIRHATVGNNLGLTLAREAAERNTLRSIIFCSVVPYGVVAAQFEFLARTFAGIRFDYFQKTELFNGRRLDALAVLLRDDGSGKEQK